MGHRNKSSRHRSDEDGDRRRDDKKKKRHRREDEDDKDRRTTSRNNEDGGDDDRHRDRKRQKKSRSDSLDEDRKSRKHHKKHHRDEKEDDESRSRKKKDDKKKDARRKDDKKKDDKKDKKKKSSKSESRKSKQPDTRTLISLGDPIGKPPATLLDAEKDYFAYHEHLWVYLFREEGSAFNDMTAEETREGFRRFAKRYNVGSLAEGYYVDKLPAAVLEESKTTKHSWSFRISATEGRSLHSIETGVRKQTEIDGAQPKVGPSEPRAAVASCGPEERPSVRSREDVAKERGANRRLKAHVRTAEEELNGGRKDGRERQIEKRKETGARIHGAARDRDAAAGMVEVTDADLYGGDDRNQFAKERQRHSRQNESREKRLTELQSKEKERQQAMLTQLGLTNIKPGQRITIQPRKDT
jgi:hypothetical protein